ncbi:MAG TPA: ornithine cyclodeaminase family protein [Ktedonobacterales bacterium]|jgi:ornithine cyclodeaminase/alanine dehydrogenase-like protein (mu-crystallin family)
MALVLREADVRRLLTMPDTVRTLGLAFRQLAAGQAQNTPRSRVVLPDGRGVLHVLTAAAPRQGVLGYKAYTTFRQGVRFIVMLYSADDGRLLAEIEADWLGQMRTGAASGVATHALARPEANAAGIVGTGGQARTQLMALCAVRPIKTIRAYGRDPARRQAFCEEMESTLGVEVRPAESAEEAVREAEIVVTATTAHDPVAEGAWLQPGTHVNAVGSNWANRRELDGAAVAVSAAVAVDDLAQAHLEAGDLLLAEQEGHFDWVRAVPLAAIVAGQQPGRTAPDQITLFKSLGIGLEDITVAKHVYELARQQGAGEELDVLA